MIIWIITRPCQPHPPPHPLSFMLCYVTIFSVSVCVFVCASVCLFAHTVGSKVYCQKNVSSFIKLIQTTGQVIVLSRGLLALFPQKRSQNLVFPPFALITACTLSCITCFAEFEIIPALSESTAPHPPGSLLYVWLYFTFLNVPAEVVVDPSSCGHVSAQQSGITP